MLLDAVLALESLDTAGRIDEPLLARIERMAVRANFDMKLSERGARFKSVPACAGYHASAVFRMGFGFHLTRRDRTIPVWSEYHRPSFQTIRTREPQLRPLTTLSLVLALILPGSATAAALPAAASPPASAQAAPGFSPPGQTMFAWVLQFAPPGPNRAARAIDAFSRQLAFHRKIAFHPQFGDELQKVINELPPRQSTLIRAAALYSRTDIAWNELPGGIHQISVAGEPAGSDYRYVLTHKYARPEAPMHMAGAFTLKPAPGASDGDVKSVVGGLGGELVTNTYGAGAMVDAMSELLRQIHGNLQPPWDTEPGKFNQHDRELLARMNRQMPAFTARLEHYLKIDNLIDVFDYGGGPVILLNLDAEIREDALKPFPDLYRFYRRLASVLHARTAIVDSRGDYWMLARFERGHIHVTFMDRGGMLLPFNSDYRPAGPGIVPARVTQGRYRTDSSVLITRLGMKFGLKDLDFATLFRRTPDSVAFDNRMDAVPDLVAPPVIHGMAQLIAGRFLQVMAQGNGGFRAHFASDRTSEGLYRYSLGFRGEFIYSPTLEFLARIGDSLAEAHNVKVRTEERQVGEQLFDAFVTDYNNERPAILALDTNQEGSK